MPDAMDRVQELVALDLDRALRLQTTGVQAKRGLTRCERVDCDEAIAPQRTACGARLCHECQEESDKRAAHFATWARR